MAPLGRERRSSDRHSLAQRGGARTADREKARGRLGTPASGRHSPPKAGGGKDLQFRGGPFSAGIPAFGVIRTFEWPTPFATLGAPCLRPVRADGNEPPAALRAAVPGPTGRTAQRSALPDPRAPVLPVGPPALGVQGTAATPAPAARPFLPGPPVRCAGEIPAPPPTPGRPPSKGRPSTGTNGSPLRHLPTPARQPKNRQHPKTPAGPGSRSSIRRLAESRRGIQPADVPWPSRLRKTQ